MSVVGPRPLVVKYLPYYTEEEMHRHDVRPGLSGWAQVNGRNGLQWEERFAYDVDYVNRITFFRDVKIIFLTVRKVFQHENVAVRGMGKTIDFDQYRLQQWEQKKNGEKHDK